MLSSFLYPRHKISKERIEPAQYERVYVNNFDPPPFAQGGIVANGLNKDISSEPIL